MLGKTPSWALSDEQLLAAGPSRLRMAWVDTCLKPGPGSRKAGLVVGKIAMLLCRYVDAIAKFNL